MMPEVEQHQHHHPTGNRRLDLVLPICALFVSATSVVLAVIDGHNMERMADANARLVEANSWPLLQYTTSNQSEDRTPFATLGVMNAGVGPARVESFEVFWRGRPARNARDFLTMCCGLKPGQLPGIADAKGSVAEQIAQIKAASQNGISSSEMAPAILQARQGQAFLALPFTEATAPVYHALNTARLQLTMRACYCSVFDECWISDLRTLHPQRVKVCPRPKIQFGR